MSEFLNSECNFIWSIKKPEIIIEFESYDRYGEKYVCNKSIFISPGVYTIEQDIDMWPYPIQT